MTLTMLRASGEGGMIVLLNPLLHVNFALGSADYHGIPAGASKTVSFKPLIGIFNQSKYMPLMWGGFVVELELMSCY